MTNRSRVCCATVTPSGKPVRVENRKDFTPRSQAADMPQEYRLILKNADAPGYTPDLECYLRHGGYEALKKALSASRRRILPDGKTMSAAGADSRGSARCRACAAAAALAFRAG